MFLIWLIILIVYGILHGFAGQIHPLFWCLLLVFFAQDSYDYLRNKIGG